MTREQWRKFIFTVNSYRFNSWTVSCSASLCTSVSHSVRVKCLIKIVILWILCVNFAPFCDCLCWNCFVVTYVCSSCFIWVHYAVIFIVFTISGDRTFCDWKFAIINFVITKYHTFALSKFLFIDILKFYFVDLPCSYRFLLFISCLLIYMLNYLLFLSMVHENAYFYEYIWKPVY